MVSLDGYEDWLILNGYKEKTPSGRHSTVYDYTLSIKHILSREGINITALANNIDNIIKKYDKGGIQQAFGAKRHNTNISSLKCFKTYVIVSKMPFIVRSVIKAILYALKPLKKVCHIIIK